jgi:hypothetical protein
MAFSKKDEFDESAGASGENSDSNDFGKAEHLRVR